MADDNTLQSQDATDQTSVSPGYAGDDDPSVPESDRRLVAQIQKTIKADKRHHDKAFIRMRRDMQLATHGAAKAWLDGENYVANISGRHVKQKAAALYAKNPKIVAKRRETLDYAVWDENPQSLLVAFQLLQTASQMQAAAAQAPPAVDPVTGQAVPQQVPLPPGFDQAQATMQDFQQGTARREMLKKTGKTLEILFAQAMREQKPLDFKTGAKRTVRRACTTGVGYIELGFQREYGPRPGMDEELADIQSRLDHLRCLTEEIASGDVAEDDPEISELKFALAALQAEPEVLLREGLIIDFPTSTSVIPDRLAKSLVGFVGASHVTIQYLFTPEKVKELFSVDMKGNFTSYNHNGKLADGNDASAANTVPDEVADDILDEITSTKTDKKTGLVCVWKHYDKTAGLVYFVADGHKDFLRPPAAPDVFVEDFWPLYALTFNDVENEEEVFPPSDVALMLDMQNEYNRSRQGLREHRHAARPRWGYTNGRLDDEDIASLMKCKPFDAIGLNKDAQDKLADILETIPVPGVDPNLYETGPIFADTQIVVGSQQAQFGGVAKATATESAIAANSTASADGSSIDDLDNFLTTVARAGGQILLKEMSPEKVMQIVGPGAVWPHMSLAEIADELFLEVEAGSTGKPNQAIEINNWKEMLPFLLQIGAIDKTWLARETLRRLDDRMDLTDAIVQNIPAIVAQNRMAQPSPADPNADPAQQGPQGAANTPAAPAGPGGSGPAFGSNQM